MTTFHLLFLPQKIQNERQYKTQELESGYVELNLMGEYCGRDGSRGRVQVVRTPTP